MWIHCPNKMKMREKINHNSTFKGRIIFAKLCAWFAMLNHCCAVVAFYFISTKCMHNSFLIITVIMIGYYDLHRMLSISLSEYIIFYRRGNLGTVEIKPQLNEVCSLYFSSGQPKLTTLFYTLFNLKRKWSVRSESSFL